MTYNLLLTILIFLFPSCSRTVDEKDLAFSEKQLDLINPYKINDTLIFENKNYLPDTIIIHSFAKAQNFLSLNIKPIFGGNWQEAKTDWGTTPTLPYQKFIALSKTSEENKGSVFISFKGFQSSFIPDTIKSIKKLMVGDKTYSCYILHHQFPEKIKNNSYIITLYWDKKQGLVAYQSKGEARWVKKTKH